MNDEQSGEEHPAPSRPVPGPPKHPLTQPIPIGQQTQAQAQAPRAKRRRQRRRRKRLPDKAVVFIGPMAAGKTSLGRQVAKELGVPFVDTDAVFVRDHGPIVDFFAAHGEAEFRRLEAAVIAAELGREGSRIVALGGGAVLSDETRALLKNHPVILLMTTQEAVLRTANLARRPLLRDDPDAWGRILDERRHLYEEVADVTFRTDRSTKAQLTLRVSDWVRRRGNATRRRHD